MSGTEISGASAGGTSPNEGPPPTKSEASIEVASRSDVGQVRSANEDSCEVFPLKDGSNLLVLADGMGGHRGGATASSTAVSTISEAIGPDKRPSSARDALKAAIEAANARIYEMAQADPELEGMGTTVVTFLLDRKGRGTVAHVGDSRAYRYRLGELSPLTTDHSVVAEMQKRGLLSADEAAVHPRRNEILRSVGVLPDVEVEVAKVEVKPGDRIVLCSDGLSGVVADDEIAAVVQMEKPARAVDSLIQMANERGGPDNISVQILSVPADASSGDPEATAPVELSEVGIRAIEAKRMQRRRLRQIGLVLLSAAALGAAYYAWQFWQTSQTRPSLSTTKGSVEADSEEQRRGIPR
ncbi:MAG: Stp1/IreP family PP2C-type Ser/Thr phosphatase [Myxococcota bacterium]